jgi:hypothetical protein
VLADAGKRSVTDRTVSAQALPIGERDTSSSYFEWHVGEGLTQLQACHEVAPPMQRAAAL